MPSNSFLSLFRVLADFRFVIAVRRKKHANQRANKMISWGINVLGCTYSQKENQWFDICRHIFSSKPDVLGFFFLMWKSILRKEMHAKQNPKSLHFILKSLQYQQNGMSTLQHTLSRFIDNGYNGLLKPQMSLILILCEAKQGAVRSEAIIRWYLAGS